MKVLSTNDYSNIKLNQESIDIKDKKGRNIRLFVDHDTNKIRLVVNHELLSGCDQTDDFTPYVEVGGFYND